MRKACVVGYPIRQSLSPVIHGHWLKRHRIAGSYIARELHPIEAGAFLSDPRSFGFIGCNVTIPHKELAYTSAAVVTDIAGKAGAANTLYYVDDVLHADNTDVYGFLANLDESAPGWDRSGGRAIVLGAGGAARAILLALGERGFEIILANRTQAKAEALREAFSFLPITVIPWSALDRAAQGASLVVNTTSLGMAGEPDLAFPVDRLPQGALVTDIVYKPLITTILRQASQRGLQAVTGIGMLLHQAVPGFERWFGVRPEVNEELRRLVLSHLIQNG